MVEVVVVDGKGRVTIPSKVRERVGLFKGSKLLLVEVSDDTIILKKLDVKRVLEAIAKEVRRGE